MGLGLLTMLWLLPGARTIGSVTFDVHTLLYAASAVFIGFQSLTFAVFSKVYGVVERLLPEDPRLNKLFRYVTLETGIAVGLALIVTGLGVTVWAVSDWGAASYGDLDPQRTLRLVVPAMLSLTLGFQTLLSSFFLSVLGLGIRRS